MPIINIPPEPKADISWQEALELCSEIYRELGYLPDNPRAESFGTSITERTESIEIWIAKNQRVTQPQSDALHNMLAAVEKWTR